MLIIEDDAPFVDLLRETLGLRDVRVARTMAEAMAMISETTPDIILLDLTLPDSPFQRTVDLLHDIKTRSNEAIVIVITGHPDIEHLQTEVLKAGAQIVLSKNHGFFNSLSDALLSSGWTQAPCASQAVVEQIEDTVKKIVRPSP